MMAALSSSSRLSCMPISFTRPSLSPDRIVFTSKGASSSHPLYSSGKVKWRRAASSNICEKEAVGVHPSPPSVEECLSDEELHAAVRLRIRTFYNFNQSCGVEVASVEVPQYITFHFINAYEEDDDEGRVTAIIADCCEHNADTSILEKLRLQNLQSLIDQDVLPDARVGRFRIPLNGSITGSLISALDPEEHGRGMDMCSINPHYLGRPYRYAYACGARRPCNFPNTLTKIDLLEKTAKSWHDEGSIPSEPFFVARPGATEEDDGVVISIVSGKDGEGYALLLDAFSFQEIARAKFPYALPYGLHGCWVPKK